MPDAKAPCGVLWDISPDPGNKFHWSKLAKNFPDGSVGNKFPTYDTKIAHKAFCEIFFSNLYVSIT